MLRAFTLFLLIHLGFSDIFGEDIASIIKKKWDKIKISAKHCEVL